MYGSTKVDCESNVVVSPEGFPRTAHVVLLVSGPLVCDNIAGLADQPSRRRDCHSAAPPSPSSRCFNMDGEGMSVK